MNDLNTVMFPDDKMKSMSDYQLRTRIEDLESWLGCLDAIGAGANEKAFHRARADRFRAELDARAALPKED